MALYGSGSSEFGQLCSGSLTSDFLSPQRIFLETEDGDKESDSGSAPDILLDIACGLKHTLFLTDTGQLFGCGSNESGQLALDVGQETRETRESKPTILSHFDQLKVIQVACGESHSAAVLSSHHLLVWGSNASGQLGLSSPKKTTKALYPTEVNITEVVKVACGTEHTMALTSDGSLWSWGANGRGQLGLGRTTMTEPVPTAVRSLAGVPLAQIVSRHNHTLALSVSAAIFAWGANEYGQLGCGDTNDRAYPLHIKALRYQHIVHLSCGEGHSAVLSQEGRVFTFGADSFGQLGHGKREQETVPKAVFELTGSNVSSLSCGRCHTVAVIDGKVYSFGLGNVGQLGLGHRSNRLTPAVVTELAGVRAVFAGGDRTFFLGPLPNLGDGPLKPPALRSFGAIARLEAEMISSQLQSPDSFHDLVKDLETVMSSPACLNCSFLKKENAHFGANRKNHGLDMDGVMETARLMREPGAVGRLTADEREILLRVMRKAVEWSLLPELVDSPPDMEALRLYLILPWFPIFDGASHFRSLHLPFASALCSLAPIPLKVIESWWSALETRHFNRLLKVYKSVVVRMLSDWQSADANEKRARELGFRVSLSLLSKLNAVNKQTHKLMYDAFYIQELVDTIDIRMDYLTHITNRTNKFNFCDYSFILNAEAKTLLLQTDAQVHMQLMVEEANQQNFQALFFPHQFQVSPFLHLLIQRNRIVEDTISQLLSSSSLDLKKPLKVQFVNEEADDAGGVKKEFFLLLFQEIFHKKYGMFSECRESNLIWFAVHSFEEPTMYQLVGMLIGLAIYNSVLLHLNLPLALYKKLLSQPVALEDLKDLSPTEGRSLEQIQEYDGEDFEETFGLTFEISISDDVLETVLKAELKPGGAELPVTNENREDFVQLYVNYRLNVSVEKQFDAFADGFHRVVNSRLLSFFQPRELMEMVAGNENYDWVLFEKNTEYKGEYWRNHPTIELFWNVFHELSLEEKKKFLLFLTGSDRIPLLGMKQLRMCIQPSQGGAAFYPVAHTCFNLLDLSRITDLEDMRHKLRVAIQHNMGFTLV